MGVFETEVVRHGNTWIHGQDKKINCPECNAEDTIMSVNPTETKDGTLALTYICKVCGCVYVAKRKKD